MEDDPARGVFRVICPGEETGAGLASARWPDQKPVRLSGGVTVTVLPLAVHPRPAPVRVPQLGLEVVGMLADQLDYVIGVDPHRDAHALAVVQSSVARSFRVDGRRGQRRLGARR